MICTRVNGTFCISEVKGHVEADLVRRGQVREVDRVGDNRDDEAADFGWRRVGPDVIDARRNLCGGHGRWYPDVRDLQRLFIAISRAFVNDVGSAGTAPHPLVWSAVGLPTRRRVVHAVRDAALLFGPAPIWESGWVCVLPASVTADDVCLWPYSVGVLVKLVAFLGTLHWPVSDAIWGVGGGSCVEVLVVHELWTGEARFGEGCSTW